MKFIENPPDGYNSWDKFKEDNNQFPEAAGFPDEPEYKNQVNILSPKAGMITLFPNGTWSYDCAPFWDGSS